MAMCLHSLAQQYACAILYIRGNLLFC